MINQMKLNYNAVLPNLLETIKAAIKESENELNLKNIREEETKIQLARKKLLDGYINNVVDENLYKIKDTELEQELFEVQSEIVRIESIVENEELLNQRVEKFKSILSDFSEINKFDSELFDAFVRRIELEEINEEITSPYNAKTGYVASTTGNITGIYDMAGGALEYVMVVMADASGNPLSERNTAKHSGFMGGYGEDGSADSEYTR